MSSSSNESGSSFHYSFEDETFKDVVAFSHDHLSRIGYMELDPLEGDRLYRIGMEGVRSGL